MREKYGTPASKHAGPAPTWRSLRTAGSALGCVPRPILPQEQFLCTGTRGLGRGAGLHPDRGPRLWKRGNEIPAMVLLSLSDSCAGGENLFILRFIFLSYLQVSLPI